MSFTLRSVPFLATLVVVAVLFAFASTSVALDTVATAEDISFAAGEGYRAYVQAVCDVVGSITETGADRERAFMQVVKDGAAVCHSVVDTTLNSAITTVDENAESTVTSGSYKSLGEKIFALSNRTFMDLITDARATERTSSFARMIELACAMDDKMSRQLDPDQAQALASWWSPM